MEQQVLWFLNDCFGTICVQAAGTRRRFERGLFSAATFEAIELYIICLTANQ